jgi:BirA family transcriptional regulator, biotin operon repressor / biotin---[acetyl-CoA-carboxylase] ligase
VSAPGALPADIAIALASGCDALEQFGSHVLHYHTIGSTNDVAARLALNGAPEGSVVIADEQTKGRGRSGHSWFSPPESGLYVSVVLRPLDCASQDEAAPWWSQLVTLAAGVALAEGLRHVTRLPVQIKWPNDIVVSDARAASSEGRRWRKLAGILAEGHTTGGVLQHIVLGYGINLRSTAYPPDLADRATSLEAETGRPVERAPVLVQTLLALKREYSALRRGKALETLERWRSLAPLAHGSRVRWEHRGTVLEGVTAGINDRGALQVLHDGRRYDVGAGEVTWL